MLDNERSSASIMPIPSMIKLARNIVLLTAMFCQVGASVAQTFTVLQNFSATQQNTNGVYVNAEGASPFDGLVSFGGYLYGTSAAGGSEGSGTIFRIKPDGTGFVVLKTFSALGSWPNQTNSDGANLTSRLTPHLGALYGVAASGGNAGSGTIFKINTNGTGFEVLKHFSATDPDGNNSDGAYPASGLTLSGNSFYGTATLGGNNGSGTLFKIDADGTGFTVLRHFSANERAAWPYWGLLISGDVIYGYAEGSFGSGFQYGRIYSIKTDGTEFTNLHSFNTSGIEGIYPQGTLLMAGNEELYGATSSGGDSSATFSGTIFKMSKDGTGFTVLKRFDASNGPITDDGYQPQGGLILSGNVLYGTTAYGGHGGSGTVFKLFTDGTGFSVLKHFDHVSLNNSGAQTNSDGALSRAGLLLELNTLYGETTEGGSGGSGTLFSLGLFQPSIQNVINTTDGHFGFANGGFGFTVNGPVGSTVVISYSTNNLLWTVALTKLLSELESTFYFFDSSASNQPVRLYKAEFQP
ncbi:MAG TPA: choice-of-anchor tandem repeat GloVer-containing protein [Verrucomicrobiae bacterium]|nr:choice-of-anchor tandem repeat GloVer-containing protein [Verrucomicrobiae bacterium]